MARRLYVGGERLAVADHGEAAAVLDQALGPPGGELAVHGDPGQADALAQLALRQPVLEPNRAVVALRRRVLLGEREQAVVEPRAGVEEQRVLDEAHRGAPRRGLT